MAIGVFSAGGKQMYAVYTYTDSSYKHQDKRVSIAEQCPAYRALSVDSFFWSAKQVIQAGVGSDSGTRAVKMTLQVTAYDAQTGTVTIHDTGSGNCGLEKAVLYAYG